MSYFQIYAALQSCQVSKRRNDLSRKKLVGRTVASTRMTTHTAMLQDTSFFYVKLTLLETFILHHHSLFHGQALWWVDYGRLPGTHPTTVIFSPQQDKGENKIENLKSEDTDREMDYLAFTIKGKTDSPSGKN